MIRYGTVNSLSLQKNTRPKAYPFSRVLTPLQIRWAESGSCGQNYLSMPACLPHRCMGQTQRGHIQRLRISRLRRVWGWVGDRRLHRGEVQSCRRRDNVFSFLIQKGVRSIAPVKLEICRKPLKTYSPIIHIKHTMIGIKINP